MMAVHLKLLSVQSMATVNVLLTNLEILNVVQGLEIHHQITKVERLKLMKAKSVEKDRVLAVLALMMAVHLKLLSVQSMATVNVLLTNLEILNVVQGLEIHHQITKVERLKVMKTKSVEKDRVLAVLALMMAVHLKLLSVQSLATVNVLLTNLEILNVVQGLEIQQQITKVERIKAKSVEKERDLVVLDLMMAVHLKLLSVQNGVIVNVLNINLGIQNVVLDFLAKKHQEGVDQAGKANLRKAN